MRVGHRVAKASLLVLAGGLGTRFGGTKQLAAVGPGGAAILDHSIREARNAGVERIVVVGRSDLDAELRSHLTSQHPDLELTIVHQDCHGPRRVKPWGTGHAVISALSVIDGPVVVLNADDYYGPTGIAMVAKSITEGRSDEVARGVMLGFRLGQTLPTSGSVSRGVCEVDGEGRLVSLVETHGIERRGDEIWASTPPGELDPETPVSMNIWGLSVEVVTGLVGQWNEFLETNAGSESIEFLLPVALDEQRQTGKLVVDVLDTEETWIGITNRLDLVAARSAFAEIRH
ncbi:MAG TPA: hypothetical protein DCR10_01495 [Acidimicrobiaceae bacterium]|nr:hypothetical protein [Acidimicrobiaceae bacterium]